MIKLLTWLVIGWSRGHCVQPTTLRSISDRYHVADVDAYNGYICVQSNIGTWKIAVVQEIAGIKLVESGGKRDK